MRTDRRLDHRLMRSQFGTVGQADGDQIVERALGVDQGELQVIVLQRLDHGPRIEAKDARQLGAGDAPLLAGGDGLLLEVGQQVPRPVHFDAGNQVPAQGGNRFRPARRPRSTV